MSLRFDPLWGSVIIITTLFLGAVLLDIRIESEDVTEEEIEK